MRKNSKFRTTRVESLENRQLMATDLAFFQSEGTLQQASFADVSFNASTGTLNIKGTPGRDRVAINDAGDDSRILVNDQFVQNVPTKAIRAIRVNLGAGNDQFDIQYSPRLNPQTVDLFLGAGAGEQVNISANTIGKLRIDARASIGTVINLNGTSVTDRFFADMGADYAEDYLGLGSSHVNKLELETGGGNDRLVLFNSIVTVADVNMGAGDDQVENHGNSAFLAGTIDGGSGSDFINDSFRRRGLRVASFERR